MSEPIFSLVAAELIATSEGTNYASGAAAVADHDEVLLLDANGAPGFVPTEQDHVSLDIEHRYADGSIGQTPVIQQHRIAGYCDLMDGDLRRKLERWKRDRAEVLFTPGFGRRTELAWRPLVTSAATFLDLTGKYTLTIGGDATRNNAWDPETGLRIMRDGFTGKQRILKSPGGAAQIFEGATENRFAIDAPGSGTPGWTASGAGAASITVAHVANGFGHVDCPHSVRITGTATTDARAITAAALPAAVNGQGVLDVAIFVKGRLPTNATIGCEDAPGGKVLGGEYGDWTYVATQYIDTFVDADDPYIYVDLTTAVTAETFDFELAARTAVFTATSLQRAPSTPQWQAQGAARTADSLLSTAAVAWPRNGSKLVSFYVPADWDDTLDSQWIGLSCPASGSSCELSLLAYNGNTRLRAVFYFDAAGAKYVAGYADAGLIVPGAMNSMGATWSGKNVYLYLNGTVIASSTAEANAARDFAAVAIKIGAIASGPFQLCAIRLEREPWTAERMAQEHRTMTDPGALELTVAARGRRYRINRIPSTPYPTAGKVFWSGPLEIEQVGYDPALADITSMEPA